MLHDTVFIVYQFKWVSEWWNKMCSFLYNAVIKIAPHKLKPTNKPSIPFFKIIFWFITHNHMDSLTMSIPYHFNVNSLNFDSWNLVNIYKLKSRTNKSNKKCVHMCIFQPIYRKTTKKKKQNKSTFKSIQNGLSIMHYKFWGWDEKQ